MILRLFKPTPFSSPSKSHRHAGFRRRSAIEPLEARIAPATTITIIAGTAGSGTQDANLMEDGKILFGDADNGANTISTGALASIPAGTSILIQAADAIHFNDLGGSLTLLTGPGASVSFNTAVGGGHDITFSETTNSLATSGGDINFIAGTDVTVGDLNSAGGAVIIAAGTIGAGNVSAHGIAAAGTGNISIQAINAAGGTITQSGTVFGAAINATATGNVVVDALEGSSAGVTSNTGSIASFGANPITTSGHLSLSAATGISIFAESGSLEAVNATSGTISITAPASPATGMTITATGVVNHAAGGTVALTNLGGPITISGGVAVQSNDGSVTLAATDFVLSGTINSGTASTTLSNSVSGTQFDIGTNTAGKIGLTSVEINNVTAGVLRIGGATAGSITLDATINPAHTNTLSLITNSTVFETNNGFLTIPNLRVSTSGSVVLATFNAVGVLAADAPGGLGFANGTTALSVGTVDGVSGITTSNADISLLVSNLDIQQNMNAGTGKVVIIPVIPTEMISLGGADAGGAILGLTDTELGHITASVVQINAVNDSGSVSIDSAITRHAGFNALDLETGGMIIQGAALSVANLALFSTGSLVTLTNAGNDVDTLAIHGQSNVLFTDSNALTIGSVSSVSGAFSTGNLTLIAGGALTINQKIGSGSVVGISAGGAVTQDTGNNGTIQALGLNLYGAGPYTLNNPSNAISVLSGNVSGNVNYINAGSLAVGSLVASGLPGTNGFTASSLSITTVAGDISVSSPVTGTANVTLTAGSTSDSPEHGLGNVSTITGPSIALVADRLTLGSGVISAGSGSVTLEPDTLARPVNIDGTPLDPTGELRLSPTELNTVTAAVLRIGRLDNLGTLTLKSTVINPAGWNTLDLLAGGTISQSGSATLTVPNLALQSGADVQFGTNPNIVNTLAATTHAGFQFTNTGSLAIGTVDGISGLTDNGTADLLKVTLNGAGNTLTFNKPVSGSTNVFIADTLAINAALSAGSTGTTILSPLTLNRTIDLGTKSAGSFGLTDTELDRVTSGILEIGNTSPQFAGTITNSAAITQTGSGYGILQLDTSGAIVNSGGSIAVSDLNLVSGTGIGTAGAALAIQVNHLDFTNTGGVVNISNTGALAVVNNSLIGTASNSGGTTTLVASGAITFSGGFTGAGNLLVTATDALGNGNDLNINSGASIQVTNGTATLRAGDNLNIFAGGSVSSSGTLSIVGDFGNADPGVGANILIAGTVNGSSITLTGGSDNDTFTLGGGMTSVGLKHSVTIDGAAGSDSVIVDDTADATNRAVTIIPTAATSGTIGSAANDTLFATGVALSYANLETVSLKMGSGSDFIDVSPSTGTAFVIDGGAPTTVPGDTLHYGGAGLVHANDASNGTISLSGSQAVTYSNVETLAGNITFAGVTTVNTPNGVVVNVNGDQSFANQDDQFTLSLDATGTLVQLTENGALVFFAPKDSVYQLTINGLGGNDDLTVDSSHGLVTLAGGIDGSGIHFDGGTGINTLHLTQTDGDVQASDAYSVGPGAGDVASTITGPSGVQTVFGGNLAPAVDTVPSALLTVNGTNSSNAINYTQGSTAANGLITIDNFESLEFSNKTALIINGLAGSDVINLGNALVPTGLTSITVNGGDPTAGDLLIVNGTSDADEFNFTPTAADAGTVQVGSGPVIDYHTTEQVILNGLAGDDTFALHDGPGAVTLFGGGGANTIDFSSAATGVNFSLDQLGTAQTVNGSGLTVMLEDAMEHFVGSPFNDIVHVSAGVLPHAVEGNGHTNGSPGDKLIFDAQGSVATVQKSDLTDGTIATSGYASVDFSGFQSVQLLHSSLLDSFGTPGSSSAFNSAQVYDLAAAGKKAPTNGHMSVATGDLNQDGFADVVVANSATGLVSVLINEGDGAFLDPVSFKSGGSTPTGLVLGNFDGTPGLDLAVINSKSGNVALFSGDDSGGFNATPTLIKTASTPSAIVEGDLNGDGHDDLVVTHPGLGAISVLLANGTGGFDAPALIKGLGKQPLALIVDDFNNDGHNDIVTANYGSANINFLSGNGDGTFAAPVHFATSAHPTALAVADFNGDGHLDLAVSDATTRVASILLGNGSVAPAQEFGKRIRLALPGLHAATSIIAADFNGDGITDLGFGNTASTDFSIALGAGNARFSLPYEFDLGKDPKAAKTGAVAVVDLDNDGQLDVVTTSPVTDDVRVLLHES